MAFLSMSATNVEIAIALLSRMRVIKLNVPYPCALQFMYIE